MELSKRLQAVSDLVTAGYRVADIGTDHAYIPIYLVENHLSPCSVAMDINEGPLRRAREHVAECGLEKQIELRLSDGMESLKPGEADAVVIAGMGGPLMIGILQKQWNVTCSLKECILQPQSEIAGVRAFLLREGFLFLQEDMVLDSGKYYPMMKVKPPAAGTDTVPEIWSEVELRYGKLLLESKNPVLRKFLDRELCREEKLLVKLQDAAGERAAQRRSVIMQEIAYISEGIAYYDSISGV